MKKLLFAILVLIIIAVVASFFYNKPEAPVPAENNTGNTSPIQSGAATTSIATSTLLTSSTWLWTRATTNAGTTVVPRRPDAFTLTFGRDGRVSGKTDCNGFGGTYSISGDNISFSQFMSTLMFCENSQEAMYTELLLTVDRFTVNASGELVLMLTGGTGSIVFRRI